MRQRKNVEVNRMYKMNEWKKDCCQSGSQAVTLIEKRFEIACQYLNGGDNILNEWRARKEKYVSYTNMISFDFQHYSKHDETHSVNILESIELVLGRERVEKLSAGDLWLLLESAYYHDIGMSLTYSDLKELWEEEDFKKFIRDNLTQKDIDMKNASLWYMQADNLLNNREKMESIENEEETVFGQEWPVDMERKILLLVAEYIRRDHASGSARYLERFGCANIIQKRLYQLVLAISAAHGSDFSAVMEMRFEEKGFGIDRIHPRFVAELLRLGDLLDMDNNRFNIRAIEHYGKLPWSSEVHLRKHRAMTHILISETQISAEAEEQDYDVCRVTNDWFRYIDSEVKNLICHWSEMAPQDLGGCIMKIADCKVYHPKKPLLFNTHLQGKFEVDKVKLTELLVGTNIYDSKMDFLREYLQNALDAVKMQIWLELKDGKYRHIQNPRIADMNNLAPFDLPQKVYDDYAIEINVEIDMQRQKVELIIKDKGIGIEEECVKTISKIGAGWRERKQYKDEIQKMLKWLRPTGGFGIGIQSAFMLTDRVEIDTKAEFEGSGRKVVMHSPRTTGEVSEEKGKASYPRGTSVRMEIDLEYFQLWNQMRSNIKKEVKPILNAEQVVFDPTCDIFDKESTYYYVVKVLREYIEKVITNSFIPIRITSKDHKVEEIRSKYAYKAGYWDEDDWKDSEMKISEKEGDYRCIYNKKTNQLILWNNEECTYSCIKRLSLEEITEDKNIERGYIPCFKNVCVTKETAKENPFVDYFDICIDFMGNKAEDTLMVHRTAFNDVFRTKVEKYIENGIRVFYKYMHQMERKIAESNKISDDMKQEKSSPFLDNLWKYPMPYVRELYFEDIDLSHIVEIESYDTLLNAQKLIIKYNEIQRKDSKKEVKQICTVKLIPFQTSVLRVIKQMKNLLDEGKHSSIFVQNVEPGKIVSEKIPLNSIFRWMNGDIDNIPQQFVETLNALQENDFCIYSYKDFNKLILKAPKLTKSLVQIGDNSFYKVKLNPKVEISDGVSEKDFYEKSYDDKENERHIWGNSDARQYEKLMVSELPYTYSIETSGPYLISPINDKIRRTLLIRGYISDEKRLHFYEDFENIITQDESYQALLQWVLKHQANTEKCKLNEIDKEYRRYMMGIYQHKYCDY